MFCRHIVALSGIFSLGLPLQVAATTVVPLSLEERVQKAADVIVATVLTAHAERRGESTTYIETEYTLRVEEVVVGALQPAEVIRIRLWGGTIGNETLTAAGVRVPEVGRRYVLMLTPAWRTSNWGVIVGTDQGLFEVLRDEARGSDRIVDFKGHTLEHPAASGNRLSTAASEDSSLTVREFVSWIQRIRAAGASGDATVGAAAASPAFSIAAVDRGDFVTSAVPVGCRVGLWLHWEQYSSDTPYYLTDVREMQKWNFYSEVFGWDDTPNGDRRVGNGRNDTHGLLSDEQMQTAWGRPWGDTELAVTSRLCRDGFVAESDIAINAAYDWTFDDESIFSGEAPANAQAYRQTMLHELGHAAGLDHDFTTLSVMNYPLRQHRSYALPFMNDAEAIRNAAPHAAVARKDVAVYPFRWTPQLIGIPPAQTNVWSKLSFIPIVVAGTSLRISNFHVENAGTVAVADPALNWYLTTQRSYPAGAIPYLGRTVFPGNLPRAGELPSSMTDVTVEIPPDVKAGSYYISALVDVVGAVRPSQPTFPFAHNAFFSRDLLRVLPRMIGIDGAYVVGGQSGTATVYLSSPADAEGHDLYLRSPSSVVVVPPLVTVPPGASHVTFPFTTTPVASEQAIIITAQDRLGAQTMGGQIRVFRAGITMVTPSPAARWVIGSEQVIRWSHGLFTGAVVAVALSRDGGATYEALGSAASGAEVGEFRWKVTAPATRSARLRLTFGTTATADVSISIGETPFPAIDPVDLDGDGFGDFILQHQATGCMVAWQMRGTLLMTQHWIAPACVSDPAWSIRGAADFDNDGKADLLFQNVSTGGILVWLMNGTALRQQVWLTPALVSDPRWRVVAVADINADGAPDLVFQHATDGRMLTWILGGMLGTVLQQQQFLTPNAVADPDWQIVGAGDIDGDDKPDLFFKHAGSGLMVAWLLNGTVLRAQLFISPAQVAPEWAVAGVTDVNIDGAPDLIFQNTLSGHLVAWPLAGTTLLGQQWIVPNQVSDPRWRIVAPR
jgi:hypothetical protein